MFHVYMLTDETGSWPLLSFHELRWQDLRTPPLTLLPLGHFELLDEALECAADFGAATLGRLVEEAREFARPCRFQSDFGGGSRSLGPSGT